RGRAGLRCARQHARVHGAFPSRHPVGRRQANGEIPVALVGAAPRHVARHLAVRIGRVARRVLPWMPYALRSSCSRCSCRPRPAPSPGACEGPEPPGYLYILGGWESGWRFGTGDVADTGRVVVYLMETGDGALGLAADGEG